jgi:Tfp pilus assembly protein PilN
VRAVNLIPSEQRSGGAVATRSGGAAYLVLGLLGGFAVLALVYGLSHHQLESRRAEAATLNARAHAVEAQAAQLAPYAAFMTTREQRLRSIAQLIGGRFDWSNAMSELSRVLPSDVALSSLDGSIGAADMAGKSTSASAGTVSSATPPGTTPSFTLSGCAASQSVVAQTLVRLRLIAGVSSVALQSSTKASSGGGSSSSSSSGGGCPSDYPVFSVLVTFEPLPTPVVPSAAALTSAGSKSSGGKRPAAAISKGGVR